MNPDLPNFPNNPRAELEARLTALLLGELPADESAALREAMARDPELQALHDRLQSTIGLVRETVTTADQPAESAAPLKLSADRREKLLASFKTVTPREFTAPPKPKPAFNLRLVEIAAAIAIIGILAGLL